ncbi:MAG TPA: hypothetical protein VJ476_04445 [Rhizomicrobium sp.]|nr:hypothetical protein [Rhizomicrobium sp.]
MTEARIKVRANRSTGELEIEGPSQAVAEWWEKLWPEVGQQAASVLHSVGGTRTSQLPAPTGGPLPDVFGEFFTEFRSDITDVDKVLVAAAFIQARDPERVFSTKAANQALLDQNIKVANASENVRRLIQTKRAFVVSDGRYRVSAGGLDHLNSLKVMT